MHFRAIANSARGGPPRPPPVRDRVKSCLVFYTKNIGTKISSKKFLVKKKYWSKKLFCPKKISDTKFFYWSQAAQFDFIILCLRKCYDEEEEKCEIRLMTTYLCFVDFFYFKFRAIKRSHMAPVIIPRLYQIHMIAMKFWPSWKIVPVSGKSVNWSNVGTQSKIIKELWFF